MQAAWYSHETGTGKRYRLWDGHKETPYFIDHAASRAHRTYGEPYGLFGAGMGDLITQASTPYRIAGCFGGFRTLQAAKDRAITLATA